MLTPEHYTYLLVDVCCIIFPFAFSFHPKINFYRQWKYFVLPCLVSAIIFLVWDVFFTTAGVWGFNPDRISGLYLFHLPAEEYLFFFCIPYASLFTYYSIGLVTDSTLRPATGLWISRILIVFLAVAGALHIRQWYTSVTFLALSSVLLVLVFRMASFLTRFYLSFAIILIPFFISNGILTGSFISAPVVVYNDHYNLGIRMFTIPFEDTFYGMLLLLLNVTGFELLRKQNNQGSQRFTVAE